MHQLDPIYWYAFLAGMIPLVLIVIGYFFLLDEEEDLGAKVLSAKDEVEEGDITVEGIWKYKAFIAPLAIGLLVFSGVGYGCTVRKFPENETLAYATVLGAVTALILYWFAYEMSRPKDVFLIRTRAAVGKTGIALEEIPGNRAGTGKVEIDFGEKRQSFQALTAAGFIPSGEKVIVVAAVSAEVIEVAPQPSWYDLSHPSHAENGV
ncbi:MAG: hypothetical protein KatS3mg105_3089 [Gemmatales bacterium]|nr:MAG: hypothetical protein KatS3mg105_3089 [Gemmatales bacterium]